MDLSEIIINRALELQCALVDNADIIGLKRINVSKLLSNVNRLGDSDENPLAVTLDAFDGVLRIRIMRDQLQPAVWELRVNAIGLVKEDDWFISSVELEADPDIKLKLLKASLLVIEQAYLEVVNMQKPRLPVLV